MIWDQSDENHRHPQSKFVNNLMKPLGHHFEQPKPFTKRSIISDKIKFKTLRAPRALLL